MHSNFSAELCKTIFPQECVQGHPKVISFDTNRKRLCDFLSISTLVLSCTVSEILQVFVLMTLFHPKFRGVPVQFISSVKEFIFHAVLYRIMTAALTRTVG